MTLNEHLHAIQEHRKSIFAYFNAGDLDYPLDDMTDVWWNLNGTEDVAWWDEEPEGDDPDPEYALDIAYNNVWEGSGFTLVLVRSDDGHHGEYLMVLDNSKHVGGAE